MPLRIRANSNLMCFCIFLFFLGAGTGLGFDSLEDLLVSSQFRHPLAFKLACEVWNHSFYFQGIRPRENGEKLEPTPFVEQQIKLHMGSMEHFKKEVSLESSEEGRRNPSKLENVVFISISSVESHCLGDGVQLFMNAESVFGNGWVFVMFIDNRLQVVAVEGGF